MSCGYLLHMEYVLKYILKIHISEHHLGERLQKKHGKTLASESDEHTESAISDFTSLMKDISMVRKVCAAQQRFKKPIKLLHNGIQIAFSFKNIY